MINLVQKSCIFNMNDPSDCTLSIRINVSLGKQLSWSSALTQRLFWDAKKEACIETFSDRQMQIWHLGFSSTTLQFASADAKCLNTGLKVVLSVWGLWQHVPVAARSSHRVCKLRSRAGYGESSHISMCVVVVVIVVVAAVVVVKEL